MSTLAAGSRLRGIRSPLCTFVRLNVRQPGKGCSSSEASSVSFIIAGANLVGSGQTTSTAGLLGKPWDLLNVALARRSLAPPLNSVASIVPSCMPRFRPRAPCCFRFFLFRRCCRKQHSSRHGSIKRPNRTPMTIPAMAPPERPW